MKLFAVLSAYTIAAQLALAVSLEFSKILPHSSDTYNVSKPTVTFKDSRAKSSNPQTGGTVDLPITAWPFRAGIWKVGQGHLRRIPYCFVDKRSFDKINCRFAKGVALWADGLGGKASSTTQHSLVVQEPFDPKDFCCTQYTYGLENHRLEDGELHCEWNTEKYPKDALAIHWMDDIKLNGKGAMAQLGYTTEEHNSEAGRHWIHVGDVATSPDLAHELGHVLGLSHEHQRWDRNEYIMFHCDNLAGIFDAINHMLEDRPDLDEQSALDRLCTDRDDALEYEAPSADFVQGDGFDPATQPTLDGPGGFDMDSIMMYSSMAGSWVDEAQATLEDAVLVKIKTNDKGEKVPADDWRILPPSKVSPKDAAFVRSFYAWDEDRKKQHHDLKR